MFSNCSNNISQKSWMEFLNAPPYSSKDSNPVNSLPSFNEVFPQLDGKPQINQSF